MEEEIPYQGWDLAQLRAGHHPAWSAFFKQFNEFIQSVPAWNKWRFSPSVQDDVAQKIRTELLKAVHTFEERSSILYFIKQVGIRRCIDQVRVQARENARQISITSDDGEGGTREMDLAAPDSFDPVKEIIRREKAQQLKTCVDKLEDTCRSAVSMFYLDQLSYKEMAEKLAVTVNTVGARLSKCLEKLKDIVRKSGGFGE